MDLEKSIEYWILLLTMIMMMMMMIMINCFCGVVDRRKAFSFISSRDHCQRSSPSRISDTPRAGFEPAQSLSSGLVEWSCGVVITTTPRRYISTTFSTFLLHSPQIPDFYYIQYILRYLRFSKVYVSRVSGCKICVVCFYK